jgi:phosphoribosylanthranilate isomerase
MFIKICANTNVADARLAADLGADAVGFVFAPSKRRVTAEQVAEITRQLPEDVLRVGVFATTDMNEIEDCVTGAGLNAAQLHVAFDPAMIERLSKLSVELRLIQVVIYAVDAEDRAAADAAFELTLRAVFAEPRVWAVLIDAAKSGRSGGLGVAMDWAHVAGIVERAIAESGLAERPRVVLAGGLTPENVAEAIATLKPWGVDVASGVESEPGKKDPDRLQAFLDEARLDETRQGEEDVEVEE